MQAILANYAVGVSDLKKSPTQIIKNIGNEAVAILNHNSVEAYIVSKQKYEKMMEKIEDLMDLAESEVISRTGDFVSADFDKNGLLVFKD